MIIKYIKGDATSPQGDSNQIKLIVHCCNDQGMWGAGFTAAISKKWETPAAAYRLWHSSGIDLKNKFCLGSIQVVPVDVENKVSVVNLIGQHRYGKKTDYHYPFVRYDALREGLQKVSNLAINWNANVHMPRICCGLAGGTWDKVEKIINEALIDVDVFIYDI